MPNSVQHSGTAVDNALGIGDLYMGAPASGPTSVSGFYTGINPPSGGYTVYMNKGEGGPSIVCPANDAALIAFTQNLTGESMADVNACFAYFAGETDKMVMHNPISEMHLADLQLYLIAGVIPSYPRSGTSWKDLSGNARNGTFTNGPTFNSNGWIEFDGVDDDIRAYGAGISDYSQAFSMSVLFKIASGATWDNGFKSNIVGVNGGYAGMYGIYKDDDDEFGVQLRDSNSTITTTCSGNVVDKWYKLTATWDGSTTLKLYRNGELVSTNNTGGITGSPDNTNFMLGGSRGYGGAQGNVFEGDIASYAYYTKLLSDSEILTNYHQGSIVTNNLKFAIDPSNLTSFQNGTTIAYNQTGSVNGTLTNGVSFSSAANGVWDFDGIDDMIDTPSLTETDLEFLSNPSDTGGLTYSIWSKNDSSSSYYLLSTGSQTSSTGVALSYQAGSGFVSLDTGTKNMSFGISSYWPLNEWVHFTFVQDELTWYFYKNGVQIGTGGINGTSTDSDLQPILRIAGPNNSTCCRFEGQVGSVLVYDRALTAGEVAQNYNANVNRFN